MTERLLLNVLFLLLVFLFVPVILRDFRVKEKKRKIIITIFYSMGVILSMSYPIQIEDGVIFDLRYVATIIGGL